MVELSLSIAKCLLCSSNRSYNKDVEQLVVYKPGPAFSQQEAASWADVATYVGPRCFIGSFSDITKIKPQCACAIRFVDKIRRERYSLIYCVTRRDHGLL